MRNLKLVDAVVALHEIARIVEEDVGQGQLSKDIRSCADRLHEISISEREHAVKMQVAIDKAKNDIQ